MILGHARHAKDTVAEIIKDIAGLSFESSSKMCMELFLYDSIKDVLDYKSMNECFEDRVNHRKLWNSLITAYNYHDPARLAREIFTRRDMYVGIRSNREFDAAKEEGLFDCAIWVDASNRLPLEPPDSFDISVDKADFVIDNNGKEIELPEKVRQCLKLIGGEN